LSALYPFAVFFSASYSESLFLLSSVASCYYFVSRRGLALSAAFGAIAGLCRPIGWLLSLPLLYEVFKQPDRRSSADVFAAVSPVCGLLAYCAYLWQLTGDPLAWVHAQQRWGRQYAGPGTWFGALWTRVKTDGLTAFVVNSPGDVLNVLALLFAAAMIIPVTRRFGAGYGAFIAVSVLLPLSFGGLMSLARFTAVLFPVFLCLADTQSSRRLVALSAVFACGQLVASALFYTWRPLF
jgi:hypothetical protein